VWAFFSVSLAEACQAVGEFGPAGDAGAGSDSSFAEASSGPFDASACRPGDVETYQPDTYHSATGAGQGVCLTGSFGFDAIRAFYDVCLGPQASPAQCAQFKADSATAICARCILTSDRDAHYGPLIDHGGVVVPNVAGCIELTDPSNLSCARASQALDGCEQAACEVNCPVHDTASRAAYDLCVGQANATGCHVYSQAAACVQAESDSGPSAACLAPNFADFYNSVVPLFCGQAPLRDSTAPFFDASFDATFRADARPDSPPDGLATADAGARADATGAGDAGFDSAGDVVAE
jgi:hypothetical protein